ncbi:97 kDa heat shock protein-like [Oscarella lobularis]|uniref:97 kDa heat shock protein-like n=1 Tax=Oscarella lobularis TaxID=121494 RepID=UPI003313833D
MSVVGFDFGNSSCYIAIARGGGIETIANEYSHRLTPSVISFGEKERLIGTSGQNQIVVNLKNTAWNFKTLIGKKYSDPVVKRVSRIVPYKVEQLPGDRIGVKVTYLGEETTFSPEQLVAMVLGKLKSIAEMNLNVKVVDCVVSVPSYFTDGQRRAMLYCCQIAGMNCLRLMNEPTAAALAYGIYKQDLPEPSEKPRNVVFVDMGDSAFQVCACSFNKGKLKILATASDPTLGGQDFDFRLIDHFAKEISTKYKLDVGSNRKALLRLGTACEKVKKTMSAHSQPVPLNIECLMDDKDVSGVICRADFEALCADLLNRVRGPCAAVLAASGLKREQIAAVEIIGGSSRVAAVKQIVSDVFGMEVSTTLNQDEAVARGCALQCAMLSPTFRVRDFHIIDICNSSISLSWKTQDQDDDGDTTLFNPTSEIPSTKMLTFYRKEPFELEAYYTTDHERNVHLGRFRVDGVVPTAEGDNSKVKVKARVDIHGIFKMSRAELYQKAPPAPEPMEAEPTAAPAPAGQQGAEQATNAQEENAKPESQTEEKKPEPKPEGSGPEENLDDVKKAGEAGGEGTQPQQAKGDEPPEKKAKKPKYVTVGLPVMAVIPGMTKEDADRALEKEGEMASQDKLEKERADMKNAVEEYVYNMRDKLEDSLREFVKEEKRESFCQLLSKTEDWLYEEGDDERKQVYVDKLAELKKRGDPIVRRHKEFEGRAAAFDELGKAVVHYRKIVDLHSQKVELYDHIDDDDMKKVAEAVEQKQKWMTSKMQLFSKIAKHDEPPVLVAQIVSEKESLERTCNPIVTKPKPKVEPPKDDKKEEEGSSEKEKGGEDGQNTEGDERKMEEGESNPKAPPQETNEMEVDS